MAKAPAKRSDRSAPSRTPLAEWIVGGLGLAAVLGVLAVLLWEALAGPATPPRLDVRAGEVTQSGPAWLQQVEIVNAGDTTAAAVEIEGTAGNETARVVIDYVPAHGRASAGLQFSRDPRATGLRVRTLGYQEP